MAEELVTLTIDEQEVQVPKGTNLIEAAKQLGTEVPYYCYHPHLSVPGNCRMCQLEVEGAPKLMVGCHTQAQDGMKVRTQRTSQAVKDAQASTLEMILINHPLDCTVCDQAGHCKLQDYHYEYNAKPSRFLEQKEHKPKAVPLGETVMLDAERCIACTRCVRFCDEVTETGEIGLVNRGDRVTIAVKEGHELSNALSGTVVDLCPVGALTHKKWRFNTRIWYTKSTDAICPGCSTGCNVKVYERDGQVVQVKARLNEDVNKEWLCDEGRYGFGRFLPELRITEALTCESGQPVPCDYTEALKGLSSLSSPKTLVLLSPQLFVEEYALLTALKEKALANASFVVAYRERELSDVEKILVSPDYAANYKGALFAGLPEAADEKALEDKYTRALGQLKVGAFDQVLLLGDHALAPVDIDDKEIQEALGKAHTVGALSHLGSALLSSVDVVLPAQTILEQSGLLINRGDRLQYSSASVPAVKGALPIWRIIGDISKQLGSEIVSARSDRDLTLSYLGAEKRLEGLTIAQVKKGGVCIKTYSPQSAGADVKDPSDEVRA